MMETTVQFLGDVGNFLWDNLFIINIIFSLVIIFFQRREPSTVWAWLLVLYFIPILGFILYLMIGQNFRKEKMFRMKEIEGEIKYAVRRQEESIFRKKLRLRDPELERYKNLILYNLNEAEAVITDNNDIRVYTDGEEKFKALLNEMDQMDMQIAKKKAEEERKRLEEEAKKNGVKTPSVIAEPKPEYKVRKTKNVSIKSMTRTSSWRLESEEDIDKYVEALRQTLKKELHIIES